MLYPLSDYARNLSDRICLWSDFYRIDFPRSVRFFPESNYFKYKTLTCENAFLKLCLLFLLNNNFKHPENLRQQRYLIALHALINVLKIFGSKAFEDGNINLGHFLQHKPIVWKPTIYTNLDRKLNRICLPIVLQNFDPLFPPRASHWKLVPSDRANMCRISSSVCFCAESSDRMWTLDPLDFRLIFDVSDGSLADFCPDDLDAVGSQRMRLQRSESNSRAKYTLQENCVVVSYR